MSAQGELVGDIVRVTDTAAANRLYNKGFLGAPETGNTLRLSIVEAVYAMATDRLKIAGWTPETLLVHAAEAGNQAEVDYLVYHDLRERGLVVRPASVGYDVWPRGEGAKGEPWFRCHPVAERSALAGEGLLEMVGHVASVVDEDGGVTHYKVAAEAPRGNARAGTIKPGTGHVLDDRVLVTDSDLSNALAEARLGVAHRQGRILSFTEAEALRQDGTLVLPDDLPERAAARQARFATTLQVFQALRAAGVLAKSGFKFGTHLRGYAEDPDAIHAEWIIHCCRPDEPLAWQDISRGVRLAHGVRKTFLVALARTPVQYVGVSWFRP